jgi:endogenous inhibitor of DNA gyrase (YacG/DUF329 family)
MEEEQRPLIQITDEDIAEANRLSLNCPICAGAVEANADSEARAPVVCAKCQTLYHAACWQQNNGKCAILGCGHDQFYSYGEQLGALLRIRYADIPKDVPQPAISANGSKKLKEQEKRLQKEMKRRTFWNDLVQGILRAFGWR